MHIQSTKPWIEQHKYQIAAASLIVAVALLALSATMMASGVSLKWKTLLPRGHFKMPPASQSPALAGKVFTRETFATLTARKQFLIGSFGTIGIGVVTPFGFIFVMSRLERQKRLYPNKPQQGLTPRKVITFLAVAAIITLLTIGITLGINSHFLKNRAATFSHLAPQGSHVTYTLTNGTTTTLTPLLNQMAHALSRQAAKQRLIAIVSLSLATLGLATLTTLVCKKRNVQNKTEPFKRDL